MGGDLLQGGHGLRSAVLVGRGRQARGGSVLESTALPKGILASAIVPGHPENHVAGLDDLAIGHRGGVVVFHNREELVAVIGEIRQHVQPVAKGVDGDAILRLELLYELDEVLLGVL